MYTERLSGDAAIARMKSASDSDPTPNPPDAKTLGSIPRVFDSRFPIPYVMFGLLARSTSGNGKQRVLPYVPPLSGNATPTAGLNGRLKRCMS